MKFLEEYIREIVQSLELWENYDWKTPPQPLEDSDYQRNRHLLTWENPTEDNKVKNPPKYVSLGEAREGMMESIKAYAEGGGDYVKLVSAVAGIGKSSAGIRSAQYLASQGLRVLYCMPRHDYWKDIMDNPFTDKGMWYHWRSTHHKNDEGEEMCRYNQEIKVWTGKGYRMMDACLSLCMQDGHFYECPYRQQSKNRHMIIAGVHNHVVTGMSIQNFDVVFIDEMPLSAFAVDRFIPAKKIDGSGKTYVGEMLAKLRTLTLTGNEYSGKALMDEIGGYLTMVYKNLRVESGSMLPAPPSIERPSDAKFAPEFFLFDLLTLLIPEFYAYQNGMDDWLTRVRVNQDGLYLSMKKAVWEKLPSKVVVFDGTGNAPLYEQIFDREVRVLKPEVRAVGRKYQIVERYNGSGTIKSQKDGTPTRQAHDMLEQVNAIKALKGYNRVGVVTFKDIKPIFENAGYDCLHFGGNRGTNKFANPEIDAVVVAGTPSPPDYYLMGVVAQLQFNPKNPQRSRVEPYRGFLESLDGRVTPTRTAIPLEYNYINGSGLSPRRIVSGFYDNPDLQAVLTLYRRDEIEQSLHRSRVLVRDVDVWILSSVPTTEVLDGIWNSVSEAFDMPDFVGWKRFDMWKRLTNEPVTVKLLQELGEVSLRTAQRWYKELSDRKDFRVDYMSGGGKCLVYT